MKISSELKLFIKQELNEQDLSLNKAKEMGISDEAFNIADTDKDGTLNYDEIIDTDEKDVVDAFSEFYNKKLDEVSDEEEDPKGKKIAKYIIDAPGTIVNDNYKNEWYYLNPVHTAVSGIDEDSNVTMSDAIADPLLSTVTSGMKNKKTAQTVRLVLNPVGVGIGRLISKIFKK